MPVFKRLPDAEFEIMRVIWNDAVPVTTSQIMKNLGHEKTWTPQTVLTMLMRLIEKGFLTSERIGRERNYRPAVTEQDYMQIETGNFMKRYCGKSVGSLVKTLYDGQKLSQEDLQELREWLDERM